MDYLVFKELSEIPSNYKTMVVTRDLDDDMTLIITPMRWGRAVGKETVFSSTDIDIDPLASINEKSKVYVQEDAEYLYNIAQQFSEIYRSSKGNYKIIETMIAECCEDNFEDEPEIEFDFDFDENY